MSDYRKRSKQKASDDLSRAQIRKEAQAYRRKREQEIQRAARKSQLSGPRRPGTGRPPVQERGRKSSSAAPTRRKKRVVTPRAIVSMLVLAILILAISNWLFMGRSSGQQEQVDSSVPPVTAPKTITLKEPLMSDAGILINSRNGDVLYDKGADERQFPASLTKLMTVYVAIQENKDLDKQVTLTGEVFSGLAEAGASTSGLVQGETVTIRDLLYATLLPSGGDAAQALALITSGNERSFVQLMNSTAEDLGMDSTHFVNPTGLHDPNHYTTCRDLSRLLKAGLGNKQFNEVFTSPEYTIPPTSLHPEGLTLKATIRKHLEEFDITFDNRPYNLVGAKTGFTYPAGVCLASMAVSERRTYVAITMHAAGDGENYYPAVKDAVNLFDSAFY